MIMGVKEGDDRVLGVKHVIRVVDGEEIPNAKHQVTCKLPPNRRISLFLVASPKTQPVFSVCFGSLLRTRTGKSPAFQGIHYV